MRARRLVMPVMGLVAAVAGAGYMVDRLGAQQESVDFTNALMAEVRNAQGQIVLSGQFAASDEPGDDSEREAVLSPTGVDADASGEAEVEVSGSGNSRRQEVEFAVRNLDPGAVFVFVIDGRDFATVTTDNRGRAEHERDVPLP